MLVDAGSGLILSSTEKKRDFSFEEAVQDQRDKSARSDELFAAAINKEETRRSSLEDRFKAALDAKDELDEPPPRPFDLD